MKREEERERDEMWPSSLPYELLELILDLLDGDSLLCLHAASEWWRNTVNRYAGSGRIKGRSMVSTYIQ